MKNIKKYIGILVLVVSMSFAFGQTPPPPNNGSTNGGGTTPVGGGAPISDGIFILMSTGLIYLCYTQKEKITTLFKGKLIE